MDPNRIAELEAEELHARRRRDLYKAKMYGPRPTDPAEMRELERVHASAVERLRHARSEEPTADERTTHVAGGPGMAPLRPGKDAGMEHREEADEPDERAPAESAEGEPRKVTLEDVSRLSPEHAPDEGDT